MHALNVNAANSRAFSKSSEPETDAVHRSIADVNRARVETVDSNLGSTPKRFLPLYACVAIEWLENSAGERSAARLDALLQHYAGSMGRFVDLETCAAAHRYCASRFDNYQA